MNRKRLNGVRHRKTVPVTIPPVKHIFLIVSSLRWVIKKMIDPTQRPMEKPSLDHPVMKPNINHNGGFQNFGGADDSEVSL